MLAGRDDLAVLIEGSPSPLIRFSARTLHDDWSAINQFESTEQLVRFAVLVSLAIIK